MGKIKQMPEALANQIAAGEVVERPASVVKELVENAIDAGSQTITIELREAGIQQIRIIDDGEGMDEDDLAKAFLPHATSKIYRLSDLFQIQSLGFRGEALASIGSVAKVRIESMQAGDSVGHYIEVAGSTVVGQGDASARKGTTITVDSLFYNTPARLKHLSSLKTEIRHILNFVQDIAMSYPAIRFTLLNDQHIIFRSYGTGDLRQTIANVYQPAIARQLIPIQAENLDFEVSGFISPPQLTRTSKYYIHWIINGRTIKSYALSEMLIKAYGRQLMIGRYPLAVIQITLDPRLVDVNVHPTKQTVRLSKESELNQVLQSAVAQALASLNPVPEASVTELSPAFKAAKAEKAEQTVLDFEGGEAVAEGAASYPVAETKQQRNGEAIVPPHTNEETVADHSEVSKTAPADVDTEMPLSDTQEVAAVEPVSDIQEADAGMSLHDVQEVEGITSSTGTQEVEATVPDHDIQAVDSSIVSDHAKSIDAVTSPSLTQAQQTPKSAGAEHTSQTRQGQGMRPDFKQLRYVGQIHGTYLIAESEHGFYLIDQHAAQERLRYEQFMAEAPDVTTQQLLLLPMIFHFSSSDMQSVASVLPQLATLGIELHIFGPNAYQLESYPTWLAPEEVEQTVRDLTERLVKTPDLTVSQIKEAAIIMQSCRGAIKANHYLDAEQARYLIASLDGLEDPFHCPHGRPVFVEITDHTLEKLFKRIQDPHLGGQVR